MEGQPKPGLAVAFVLGSFKARTGFSVRALAIKQQWAMGWGIEVWTVLPIKLRAFTTLVVGKGSVQGTASSFIH